MNALAKDGSRSGPLAKIAAGARRVSLITISLATHATSEPGASTLMLAGALIAFGYAAALAGMRIWYEACGPYNVDTPIYWAIGHGILKGFVPYRDMYETKPPGIFMLSALSYLVTGGGALTHVTQVIVLLFVALAPLAFVRRWWASGTSAALRTAPVYVSLWAIVLLFAAYVEDRGAEVQVEPHALAGMLIYLLLIGTSGRRAFWGRVIGIGIAIGMKEPFVLVVPAVYLVFDPAMRRPLQDFWGPLAMACATGAAILLVLGWLPAYIGIYLTSMAGAHIQIYGSPMARGLAALNFTWDDLRGFSLYLPTALFLLAGIYLLGSSDPASSDTPVRRVQVLMFGTLLAGLGVGMGGHFYNHHHIVAVPLYLALIFSLMVRSTRDSHARDWVRPVIVIVVMAAVFAPWKPWAVFKHDLRDRRTADAAARQSAQVIDSVLDQLHLNRYLWLGPGGWVPFAFTRHVPLGPLFFQQVAFFEGRYPWFVDQFHKRLKEAQVVVLDQYMTGPLTDEIKAEVKRDFEPIPQRFIPPGKTCQFPILVRRGTVTP